MAEQRDSRTSVKGDDPDVVSLIRQRAAIEPEQPGRRAPRECRGGSFIPQHAFDSTVARITRAGPEDFGMPARYLEDFTPGRGRSAPRAVLDSDAPRIDLNG